LIVGLDVLGKTVYQPEFSNVCYFHLFMLFS